MFYDLNFDEEALSLWGVHSHIKLGTNDLHTFINTFWKQILIVF